MKHTARKHIAPLIAALVFGTTPAVALAAGNSGSAPGHTKTTATTPTTTGTTSPTKAFGNYCQSQSKKHVAGQKGTPFSQCVTALAHAAKSPKTTPSAACAAMSKKHVAGSKGTPFSECVSAVKGYRGAH